jgi:uncharacterized protein
MSLLPDLDRARRYLATAPAPNPLVVAVTGSHFYGFPSPDSDLDLKGIHVAPTSALVSLDSPPESIDFLGDFEGTEVDFTSHEVGFAFKLLIKGNGNILERALSPFQVVKSPQQEQLGRLARGAVCKRFFHHYRGFMGTMRDQHARASPKTAKGLLYVYRPALTGIHLLLTGECVGDVTVLGPRYGFARVVPLAERKRAGAERGEIEDASEWEADLPALESRLERAWRDSTLPEAPENLPALSSFLVELRRVHW